MAPAPHVGQPRNTTVTGICKDVATACFHAQDHDLPPLRKIHARGNQLHLSSPLLVAEWRVEAHSVPRQDAASRQETGKACRTSATFRTSHRPFPIEARQAEESLKYERMVLTMRQTD